MLVGSAQYLKLISNEELALTAITVFGEMDANDIWLKRDWHCTIISLVCQTHVIFTYFILRCCYLPYFLLYSIVIL